MTKKDYELIAEVIAITSNNHLKAGDEKERIALSVFRADLIDNLSVQFKRANPWFNAGRFEKACKRLD